MPLHFPSLLALCFSFCALFSAVHAFNITKILNEHSDFSNFNDYLTQTQLAGEINNRRTITILAVDNGNISPLSGLSKDMIKKYMSIHVILDYYDEQKLEKLPKKTAKLTTLFQTSGQAKGQEGFVNVTVSGSDKVAFGSAVPGSSLGANLVQSVVSQPYNISILQVSSVIMPSDMANTTSSPPSPPTSHAPRTAPDGAPAPGPDAASAPKRSSTKSPPPMDGPTAEGPVADAPEEAHSGAPAYALTTTSTVAGATLLALLTSAWSLA